MRLFGSGNGNKTLKAPTTQTPLPPENPRLATKNNISTTSGTAPSSSQRRNNQSGQNHKEHRHYIALALSSSSLNDSEARPQHTIASPTPFKKHQEQAAVKNRRRGEVVSDAEQEEENEPEPIFSPNHVRSYSPAERGTLQRANSPAAEFRTRRSTDAGSVQSNTTRNSRHSLKQMFRRQRGRSREKKQSRIPSRNQQQQANSNSIAEIEQILESYARSRSASRTRVLVPATHEEANDALHTSATSARTFEDKDHNGDSDASSYHSGFSSSSSSDSSFKSAAQSTSESVFSNKHRHSWFRRKQSPSRKKTAGTIVSKARSEGALIGSRKPRNQQQHHRLPLPTKEVITTVGASPRQQLFHHDTTESSRADNASVVSRSSSILGVSVNSVRRLVRRQSRRQATAPVPHDRTESSHSDDLIPVEIGIVGTTCRGLPASSSSSLGKQQPPTFRIEDEESDVAVKKQRKRRSFAQMLTGKPLRSRSVGPTRSARKRHASVPRRSNGTRAIGPEEQEHRQPKLVGTPNTAGTSSTTGPTSNLVAALLLSAEVVRKFDDCAESNFAPRLQDPDEPLVDEGKDCRGEEDEEEANDDKITFLIDPLDIEFFLKADLGEDDGPIEEDEVSSLSLSSCSTMSSASVSSMISASVISASAMSLSNDDYGVYRKREAPSSACSLGTMRSARAMSILNGEFDAAASYDMPPSINVNTTRKISILLLEPVAKIFEIVSVICGSKTTLQETIEKAKAAAVDEKLSKQNYIGLCNDLKVMSNPNALVLRLASKTELRGSLTLAMADREMKNLMEKHLLVAVPSKSTSHECQKIRRMLWKNPKLQAWWHAANRTKPPDKPPVPRYR